MNRFLLLLAVMSSALTGCSSFKEGTNALAIEQIEVLSRVQSLRLPGSVGAKEVTPSVVEQSQNLELSVKSSTPAIEISVSKPTKALDVATQPVPAKDKKIEVSSASGEVINLVKGVPVGVQFAYYSKLEGWNLVWDASEFVLDRNESLKGDFETALANFIQSTNESGTRMKVTFYRGNKTVRVQEF